MGKQQNISDEQIYFKVLERIQYFRSTAGTFGKTTRERIITDIEQTASLIQDDYIRATAERKVNELQA